MKTSISIIFFLLATSTALTQQQVWQEFYGGTTEVSVYSLCMYNNNLVAAGFFDSIANVHANGIARWTGSGWSTFGIGMSGRFYGAGTRCLAVYNGELYAGGYFDTAGSVFSPGVARWNGTNWVSMNGGVGGDNPHVEALYVYQGQLYVGGTFTTAGGLQAIGIAKWDGSNWSAVGAPIFPPSLATFFGVYALTSFNGELYLGGTFQDVNTGDSCVTARWNGNSWQPVGSGLRGQLCKSFSVYNGKLVAGGTFYQAGSTAVSNIAQWDGSNWSYFAPGTNGTIYSFCQIGNDLYAAGTFTEFGSSPASMIGKWDGSNWFPLGTGTNAGILAVINYPPMPSGSNIVVGGFFNQAGGVTARHLATFGDFTGINSNNQQIPSKFSLDQNYPNPFNPSTTIKFEVGKQGFVSLKVYSEDGKEVRSLVNSLLFPGKYEYRFDAQNLSSGVYFYRLSSPDFTDTKKMILVK